jgi:hypothetical protein
MQAAHQPAQGEVIRRCLVVQPLQHGGRWDNGSRVGRRYPLQLGSPDRSLPEIAFGYTIIQISKVLSSTSIIAGLSTLMVMVGGVAEAEFCVTDSGGFASWRGTAFGALNFGGIASRLRPLTSMAIAEMSGARHY